MGDVDECSGHREFAKHRYKFKFRRRGVLSVEEIIFFAPLRLCVEN
jgi:hypothetical protein